MRGPRRRPNEGLRLYALNPGSAGAETTIRSFAISPDGMTVAPLSPKNELQRVFALGPPPGELQHGRGSVA